MVMKKKKRTGSAKIAEFKAHLSEYLRAVRAGNPLILRDRDTPIARVVPYTDKKTDIVIRKPTLDPKNVELPGPTRKKVDGVKALLEDRRSRG